MDDIYYYLIRIQKNWVYARGIPLHLIIEHENGTSSWYQMDVCTEVIYNRKRRTHTLLINGTCFIEFTSDYQCSRWRVCLEYGQQQRVSSLQKDTCIVLEKPEWQQRSTGIRRIATSTLPLPRPILRMCMHFLWVFVP